MDEQVFGAYRVVRQLGAGGMGEVLLARQTSLPGVERLVVIKKVLPHLARDPDFIRRFLDETRVASSLTHGNIVQVYESGEINGEYYMVMEYVDGPDLRDLLATLRDRGERIPESLSLYILIEIVKALGYAHTKNDADGKSLGLVHRDVSPANILLAYDGQVKLTDFGVAKAAARMSLSMPGTLHGKVFYVSPEQISGETCDARSDLFSLGVVAYEMLAGRRPFEGESDIMVIDLVRRCMPPPLVQCAPWVPPALAAVVSKAMSRSPSDRYESADVLQADLTKVLFELGHGMCSARTMADYLSQVRPALAPVYTAPMARPMTPNGVNGRPLDEAAEGLLRSTPENVPGANRTRSIIRTDQMISRTASSARSGLSRFWWVLLVVMTALTGTAALLGWPYDEELGTELAVGEEPKPTVEPVREVLWPVPPPEKAETMPRRTVTGTEPIVTMRQSISLRSTPKGADIYHGARKLGTTPLEIAIPKTGALRLEVRMDGYQGKTVTVGPDSGAQLNVNLTPMAMGRVKFRFFPADAAVLIDGNRVSLPGNVADLELSEGEHTLTLRAADSDATRSTRFNVRASEATALGTIELTRERQDNQ